MLSAERYSKTGVSPRTPKAETTDLRYHRLAAASVWCVEGSTSEKAS